MSKVKTLLLQLAFPGGIGVVICASAGRWNLQMVWADYYLESDYDYGMGVNWNNSNLLFSFLLV